SCGSLPCLAPDSPSNGRLPDTDAHAQPCPPPPLCLVRGPWPEPCGSLSLHLARCECEHWLRRRVMRFVMLARNPNLYSHQRIVAAAQERGHEIEVINTLHVHMNITSSRPTLRHGGRTLPLYDAVIPRIGASVTHYGLAVLRQFEMQGVYPLNESLASGRAGDQLAALTRLGS